MLVEHLHVLQQRNPIVLGDNNGIGFTYDASILCSLVHRLQFHRLVLQLKRALLSPALLRDCGGELRELILFAFRTVVENADVLALSTHCSKISSLTIHGDCVDGSLAPIWRSLGSTLTKIYIGYCRPAHVCGMVDSI